MSQPGLIREILVVDYITDFSSLTDSQKETLLNDVTGAYLLENCPNGTVIGIPIDTNSSQQKKVYFPFFSHISMPIKPGERAWAFDQINGLVSFWMTRKVQNTAAEDPNFTQDDRALLYAALTGESQRAQKTSSILFDAKTSGVTLSDVRKNAIAKSEISGEPSVRIRSKAPDLSIQGSNDTAIILRHQSGPGTGTIEIVSGLSTTLAQESVVNNEGYREVVKPIENSSTAGNLDPEDLARITVSKSFNSDEYYGLIGDDSGSIPTVCLKSDAIRIVSDEDFKIVVGRSGTESSIIIKSDGNIVITPGAQIKLSGESDDQAYLRYDDFKKIIDGMLSVLNYLQSAIGAITSATPGATALSGLTAFISSDVANIQAALETIKSQKILGS